MRLPLLSLTLALIAAPAWADYTGVAGEYEDGTQIAAESAVAGTHDYVGVADGFAGDGVIMAPNLNAPIALTSPTSFGADGTPAITITPMQGAGSATAQTQGNFTFVPEGAVAPEPPAPEMTNAQRAIANNYPINTYDGEAKASPVIKEFERASEASNLPPLEHGAVFKGRMALAGNGPRTVTVNNNADWVAIWQTQIGAPPPGRLDRGQKAVVVFDAQHAYSGYDADTEIADEDSGRIVVAARHITPSQRSAISPERSSPYAAIVLDATGKTVDVQEAKAPNKG